WVASDAGRREQARTLAGEAAQQAEALGLRWQQAEAALARAIAADDDGDSQPGIDAYQQAFSAGLAAGHDGAVARAAMGLAGLVGRTGDFEEAERWLGLAEAAAQRRTDGRGALGPGDRDAALPALLETQRGSLDYHRGRFEPALEHFRRSLALDQAAGRGDEPDQAAVHLDVGLALVGLGRYDEALEALEEALA
ncbi:MAG: tetratricopeptide repeat protein, partial [Myxococcales bacterium]|nr:tetratricopeptide repeat protein [Myxococcales bacterium]